MKQGFDDSNNTWDIEGICLDNNRFHPREDIYNQVLKYPNTIRVRKAPNYPFLIPAMKMKVKYLKSEQDDTAQDNLLMLPRVI